MNFAFYGRVSTEDQQDPASSKQWQLSRATALIEPHGGKVVAEFFDIGRSRSLPWKRREEASRLLDAIKRPDRGFDAVVIGEPHRAFYGNQYALTFPVFVHYGVELWVPEVGGKIDPDSEAHDMMMGLFGGMSKAERARIKVRVRSAMASQAANEGRFLGGRPPYGYQIGDVGPHPNPGKAALGGRMHRLERDPVAAPVAQRIFREYLGGKGLFAIAEGLTRDGITSPSAHDPARNRHRDGRAWSKSAVRAILSNPRYTGRQVWNRQRRDEVLMDVDDVAAGHETKLRWNDPSDWVWSAETVHEALVSPEDFAAVKSQMAAGVHRPTPSKRHSTARRYLLSGLVRCSSCGRRMQGTWAHGAARYRCRFPSEYALANKVDHPLSAYVREASIVPHLDEWLAQLFDDAHLDETCEALAMASEVDDAAEARGAAARRLLADCDQRLANYRAALDAGADAAVVAGWMAEVQGRRLAAERELGESRPADKLTKDDIRALVLSLKDIVATLRDADPALKAEVYAELGVDVSYDPARRMVLVSAGAAPCTTERVGEGT